MDRLKHAANLVRDHYKYHALGKRADDARVLVLEEARVIYVPIPKAANSSTKLALCPVLGIDPTSVNEVQQDPRLPMRHFSTVAPQIGPDWFVFTVVRDPWTRALSAYRDKVVRKGVQLRALKAMGLEPEDDFETYLAALARWPRKLLNDHFIPQSDLLAPIMAQTPVDIIRSEDLPIDWESVRQRIMAQRAPAPGQMGQLNVTGPAQAVPEFTPRASRLIRRLYADDFRLLGYSDQRPSQ
ncbi:sulfotransferase family 2 domain-containing protein [Qingshengfaniella alkalisoli]|uniref:Sulfotransferase family protein n=1 Tax=Qingshengfaniella alkalisoli TaxID=2599296 RepID=A0A5B8IZU2_9RHOB|nr:sulfotransferase family 2 domain-containing protein [Qingshengfaniella alkalisoli]QDY71184.1 sulfotransferase family protein [Qingshengfaniella alkalisoli]